MGLRVYLWRKCLNSLWLDFIEIWWNKNIHIPHLMNLNNCDLHEFSTNTSTKLNLLIVYPLKHLNIWIDTNFYWVFMVPRWCIPLILITPTDFSCSVTLRLSCDFEWNVLTSIEASVSNTYWPSVILINLLLFSCLTEYYEEHTTLTTDICLDAGVS